MIAVFLENGRIEVREQRKPRRAPGFALIRLLCGGICNTDLELQRGYYGYSGIPGHEFVGEVIAGSRKLMGKRVVGEINLECGRCPTCRRGLGRHCPSRSVLGILRHPGAFREFLTLPEKNLHMVPASVPTDVAVFAEPLAAACEILEQVSIPRGTVVAVLGDGKLGLLIGQVLRANGMRVHQYGRHPEKLQIAAVAGIDTRIAPQEMPEAAYSMVIEATGSSEGLKQAVRMVQARGTIVMKSTVHDAVLLDTAPLIVNEITMIGSRCGRFEPALRLLREGKVRVEGMISARFPLKEAARGFERAAEKGVLKVLLENDNNLDQAGL
jgi:threonine dehydrogenase-like Zn-dependent dehydrogenase